MTRAQTVSLHERSEKGFEIIKIQVDFGANASTPLKNAALQAGSLRSSQKNTCQNSNLV